MIECFDGECRPWTKTGCSCCPIRPFKIYQGNGCSIKERLYCKKNDIGVMISPGGCTAPQNFNYYAIDNGAYSAWVNNFDWDAEGFKSYLRKLLKKKSPDFVVVPDKVAKGLESLSFSIVWSSILKDLYPDLNQYLAVQDGMTIADVSPYVQNFGGIFVGGSLNWKIKTAEQWANLAHKHQLFCHVGRVGTWNRIVWAMRIGADSIDSSSWPQNNSWHHIENAKKQKILEVV